MICPSCQRETAAVSEIGEMGVGKLKKRCGHPDCKAPLPEEKPAQAKPVEFWDASKTGETARRLAAVEAASPPKPAAHANGAPPSFAQIVAQSEARLLQVRERIAELRSLETEEKQLALILTAAGKSVPETKPS